MTSLMALLDLKQHSLVVNFMVFFGAAGVVWLAGTRIAKYADTIAEITGIGRVAIGLVLLGGVTSLPEIAVAVFSAASGNPVLSVNNLLGGVAMQKAILAGVDGFIGKDALTVVAAAPVMLLQAALSILTLLLVAAAIVVGDASLMGIGIWAWALLGAYAFSVWKISGAQGRKPWIAENEDGSPAGTPDETGQNASSGGKHKDDALTPVIVKTVVAAAIILAAGFLLSQTGDAIAAQSGLGQSFVGAVLISLATSLPELSTVIASVRMRQYEMAISDILGTNLFNVAIIFLVDAVYAGKPVLNEIGSFSLFSALLGILLTTIYLIGLIERRNRTIARMGVDSLAILACYGGGLVLLYQLR
jgi:cation:H+ antiporter